MFVEVYVIAQIYLMYIIAQIYYWRLILLFFLRHFMIVWRQHLPMFVKINVGNFA